MPSVEAFRADKIQSLTEMFYPLGEIVNAFLYLSLFGNVFLAWKCEPAGVRVRWRRVHEAPSSYQGLPATPPKEKRPRFGRGEGEETRHHTAASADG